jgi:hypothetical protein
MLIQDVVVFPSTAAGFKRIDFTVQGTHEPGYALFDFASMLYVNICIANTWTNKYIGYDITMSNEKILGIISSIVYP